MYSILPCSSAAFRPSHHSSSFGSQAKDKVCKAYSKYSGEMGLMKLSEHAKDAPLIN